MAISLKNDSFTSLGKFNTSVLSDDYTHSTFETYKLKGSTSSGVKFEGKYKLNTKTENQLISASFSDEAKLQFPLFGNVVEIGTRRNGDLKFHFDLG